jgi:RNA polymerase sigma factor (sigma-70 family)
MMSFFSTKPTEQELRNLKLSSTQYTEMSTVELPNKVLTIFNNTVWAQNELKIANKTYLKLKYDIDLAFEVARKALFIFQRRATFHAQDNPNTPEYDREGGLTAYVEKIAMRYYCNKIFKKVEDKDADGRYSKADAFTIQAAVENDKAFFEAADLRNKYVERKPKPQELPESGIGTLHASEPADKRIMEQTLAAFAQLDKEQQTVLVLFCLDRLSLEEIAEKLNCSLDSAKQKSKKAKDKFAKALQQAFILDDAPKLNRDKMDDILDYVFHAITI